jgi:uncharacterized membrane protein HdeD (DUF308 family)
MDVVVYRQWWSYLLRALVALVFAILLLSYPGATLKTLITILGILLIIEGLVDIVRAIILAARKERWGWALGGGCISLLIGAIFLAHTEFTLAFAAVLIGIWAIISGIVELSIAFDMPAETGRGILAVFGVITIAIGIVVVLYPYGTIYALMVVFSIYLLVQAGLNIVFAIYANKLQKHPEKILED